MGSLSIDRICHPWIKGLLVVETLSTRYIAGYYGNLYHLWKSLPSMDGRPPSMDGRIHQWDATYTSSNPLEGNQNLIMDANNWTRLRFEIRFIRLYK